MAIIDELIAILGYETAGQDDLLRFNRGLEGVADKAKKLSSTLGKMSAVAGTAVGAAFGFLGKSVLDTNSKFESYLATLETIEGSSEKAQTAFDWIKDFAKTTPYEVDELTAAFIKLRSYGLNPMDGSMTSMGNAASAMGKSIDQVVEAVADAATGEFERMKELGMRAKQAGNQVTFAWTENGKQMEKTIKKNSSDITKFIYEVWDKRFGGAMDKQSKTWNGMMSGLGDTWTDFQQRIGDAGFFDTLKKRLGETISLLEKWDKDGTIDRIAKTMSDAFTVAADAIGVFVNRISTHVKFLNDNWTQVEGWLKTVGVTLGLLVARAFPVVTIFMLLGLAVDDFLTYMQGGESVIGSFIEWLRAFLPFGEELQNKLMALGAVLIAGLTAAFALMPHTMLYLVGRFIIGPLLLALTAGIKFAFAGARLALTGAIALWGTVIVPAITALSTAIGTGFAAAFAFLATPAGWAVILGAVVAALVAYFWDDLVRIWGQLDFAGLGRKMVESITNGVRAAGDMIANAINSVLPKNLQIPVSMRMEALNNNTRTDGPEIGGIGGDMLRNMDRAAARDGAAVVQNDNSTRTQTTNVNAPVTVNVREATQAPAAVGNAIGGAVERAAPSRIQSGGSMQ